MLLVLLVIQGCRAFLSHCGVRSASATAASHHRATSTTTMLTWQGLLDSVMGRADANKEGSGSGVLTPKSRVKLGDLSVSPMGKGRFSIFSTQLSVCALTVSCLDFSVSSETCVGVHHPVCAYH